MLDDTTYSRLKSASIKQEKRKKYGRLSRYKHARLWKFIDFVLTGHIYKEPRGKCDPRCPPTCRWKDGEECRKYRACSKGDRPCGSPRPFLLTRRVNFDKCAEMAYQDVETRSNHDLAS